MLTNLSKFEFPSLALVLGTILILIGTYTIKDLDKLSLDQLENPNYIIITLGFLLIISSVFIFFYSKRIALNKIISDEEVTQEDVTPIIETKTGRRFANLVYIYAEKEKTIAMGLHDRYDVFLPPGGRLEAYELPHDNLPRLVRDQVGLELNFDNFKSLYPQDVYTVTNSDAQSIGKTIICPSPIWTQLEVHEHRSDNGETIKEHFDFIYLCVLKSEVRLSAGVRKKPRWFTLDEVQRMVSNEDGNRTFIDVLAGFKQIQKIVESDTV